MGETMTQPRLPQLNRVLARAAAQRTQMLAALADGQWHTARELAAQGMGDRVARAVAEGSDGEIISGQLGYKLTRCATVEEVAHAENWLKAQAQKMIRRANQIQMVRARYRGESEQVRREGQIEAARRAEIGGYE